MKNIKPQNGFTIVEVLVSLFVVVMLLSASSVVIGTAASVNAKTNKRADASVLAFQKLQDYVNTDYNNIPLGAIGSDYEVEDFSSEAENSLLKNAKAKVYIQPASQLSGVSTTTTEFSDTTAADTSFASGSEVNTVDVYDPTDVESNAYEDDLRNNNVFDYIYNYKDPGSSNQELPAIDLGSSQVVNTIKINWYNSFYDSTNFRIEGSNNGSSWTTVSSGLARTVPIGNSSGDYEESYPVSGSYRYWRMFNVTGRNSNWILISEMEAFTGSSGDVVEQSDSGAIDFSSSDIELTDDEGDDQSIGIRFKGLAVEQGLTIDNAYIQFAANDNDSGTVSLQLKGIDVDSAAGWSGANAVDNALAANSTAATVNWSPAGWTSGDETDDEKINVTTIVQEILNRTGWSTGNDMAFGITRNSGSGKRVARKTPAPQLIIEWSETASSPGSYVDSNGDGDVDNPTLVKIKVVVEYELFGDTRKVEYSSLIRQFGIGS